MIFMAALRSLLNDLKDPFKEMRLIRSGLEPEVIESFLVKENFLVKDILERLDIPSSTYFLKKKNRQSLDTYTTEKSFIVQNLFPFVHWNGYHITGFQYLVLIIIDIPLKYPMI